MARKRKKQEEFDAEEFIQRMIKQGKVRPAGVEPEQPRPQSDLDRDLIVQSFTIPDLTEAVEGWRTWYVQLDGPKWDQVKLNSVVHDYYWKPRARSQAECGCGHDHTPPAENCSCGFYSTKTEQQLKQVGYYRYDMDSGMIAVNGIVANWGEVVECGTGWRAQFSYPVKLFVPVPCWEYGPLISKVYGVPVEIKNFLAADYNIEHDEDEDA